MEQQRAISKARWDETFKASLESLGSKSELVRHDLDHRTFDIYLRNLLADTQNSKLATMISAAQPVASLLEQFTRAISIMAQTESTVALVWGAVQALLEVSKNFTNILGAIAEMLSELTSTLPKFEAYMGIFPEAYELNEPLREIYAVYINCCIEAILFLRSNRFKMLKNILLPKIRKSFEAAREDLNRHSNSFTNSVNVATARLQRATYNTVTTTHQEMVRHFQRPAEATLYGVKFSPNPSFQGRVTELELLDKYIRQPRQRDPANMTPQSCMIRGMGGMGKTQIALQYLYRHQKDYAHIFWVESETGPKIIESFHNFAQTLMPTKVSKNQALSFGLMKNWFKQNDSWLLIFDNAENARIANYWPSCSHGSVIVTTQKSMLSHIASSEIHLTGFGEDEGGEAILKHFRQETPEIASKDSDIARKISREVGGLPILLFHAAGFATHSQCGLKDLLELLQQPTSYKEILEYDSSDTSTFQYEIPMSRLWGLALKELSPEAVQTLRILAMLSPDGVPEAMLMGDWMNPRLSFLQNNQRTSFLRLRQSLCGRHLVQINNSMGTSDLLSMHRSLKAYVIQHMDWSEEPLVLQQTFDATVEIVRKSFVPQSATQSPSNENWDTWKEYLPQVLSLEAFYKAWKNKVMPSTAFASLLSDAGTYLFEIGLRNDSIATLEIGTEVCKRMEQDDSIVPIYANVCAIHGAILAEIGLSGRRLARVPVKKALQLRQRRIETLARSNSTTIDDFLLLSNGWNDLGVLMMQNEEFEDAMDCIQKGLNIKQEWITEKDYPQKFGESYKNLAYLLVHQDQKTEAVESARKAYELMKRANGENAQATLKGKFVYGCILLATGDLGAAKRVHKDVLEKRGKLLGEVSFITKDSNYVLGEIYRLLGKPDKAEEMFRKALQDVEKAGCGEEAIARTQYHLSLVLKDKAGGHESGREWLKQAEELSQKVQLYKQAIANQLTAEQLQESDIRILDFVSSIWSGRPNLTGSKPPFPLDIRKTVE